MNYHMVLPYVSALIKDDKGRVLIGRTRDLPRKPYPLWWDLPGGKLEEGEDPADCVCREVMEELGVKVLSAKLVGVYHHSGERIRKECRSAISGLGMCYEVEIEGEIVPTEQDNVHFADVRELKSLKLTPWAEFYLDVFLAS